MRLSNKGHRGGTASQRWTMQLQSKNGGKGARGPGEKGRRRVARCVRGRLSTRGGRHQTGETHDDAGILVCW